MRRGPVWVGWGVFPVTSALPSKRGGAFALPSCGKCPGAAGSGGSLYYLIRGISEGDLTSQQQTMIK